MAERFIPAHDVRPFRFWCQRVLPAVYDDSLTYYELLCKVIHKLNEVIEQTNETGAGVEELQGAVEQIQQELQDFKEHGFDDYYAQQVEEWVQDNLDYIFAYVAKQVYFGLTLDGHFIAYIPESWSDIVFDTGMNYADDTYGRLILRWDADSPYTVNQLPERVR